MLLIFFWTKISKIPSVYSSFARQTVVQCTQLRICCKSPRTSSVHLLCPPAQTRTWYTRAINFVLHTCIFTTLSPAPCCKVQLAVHDNNVHTSVFDAHSQLFDLWSAVRGCCTHISTREARGSQSCLRTTRVNSFVIFTPDRNQRSVLQASLDVGTHFIAVLCPSAKAKVVDTVLSKCFEVIVLLVSSNHRLCSALLKSHTG